MINKITTANSGKEGLLKINEVIDKTITGVTFSNSILSIRTQDGTSYTANLPQMPNGIISGGDATVDPLNALVYEFTPVVYNCQGTSYSISDTGALTITLNPGDPTDDRIDIVVGTTSGTLQILEGTPGTPTVAPTVAPNQTYISQFLVQAGATASGGTGSQNQDFLPLAGGTMTGNITMNGASNLKVRWNTNKYIGEDSSFWSGGLILKNTDNAYVVVEPALTSIWGRDGVDIQSLTNINMYSQDTFTVMSDTEFTINDGYSTYFKLDTSNDTIRFVSDNYTILNQPQLIAMSTSSSQVGVDAGTESTLTLYSGNEAYFEHRTNSGIINSITVGNNTSISPVDFVAPGLGSFIYSNRNVTIMADESNDVNIQATNILNYAVASITNTTPTITDTVTTKTLNVNGVNKQTYGWTLINTTGNTATYSEVILPVADLPDGIYTAKIVGAFKVTDSLNAYVEYRSYILPCTFNMVGGVFDFFDFDPNGITFGDGAGFASINGSSGGLKIDFTSMTVYNNTYTTTHNAVIELVYMPA